MKECREGRPSLEEIISRLLVREPSARRSDPAWPRITVVTPSFNQVRYLEQSMLSVLNQQYPNLEYIVLDGGSTDGSIETIRKYEAHLSYWTTGPDGGQAAAIAHGFSRSSGEILAWLNSDDLYLPDALRHVGEAFRTDEWLDVVYGDMYILDGQGAIVGERRLADCGALLNRLGLVYGGFGLYQPSAFWRKSVYERVGGLDQSFRFCMDNDLFIRFALHRARFRHLRKRLAGFRIHPTSKTSTLQTLAASEFTGILNRYRIDRQSFKAMCVRHAVRAYRGAKYLMRGDARYLAKRLWTGAAKWGP